MRPALIGATDTMRRTSEMVRRLGPQLWPVLITGETGTGKEVVARAIHHAGGATRPFVVIDCSSLVGPLLESELFGHTQGAFTGADRAKQGLLAAAHNGTAFFDEIGELPWEFQAKLLRVLQERAFRPVGSLQMIHADFRVLAATNRNLPVEVEQGRFRQDLYYRLCVVSLQLAPLRDRKQDIALLAEHFLSRDGHGHRLSEETLTALVRHDWPGNVRELENCLQQAIALSEGEELTLAELPEAVRRPAETGELIPLANRFPAVQPSPAAMSAWQADPPVLPLQEVERRAIMAALQHTRHDYTETARLLGIGRATLYRKRKEYGLESPSYNTYG